MCGIYTVIGLEKLGGQPISFMDFNESRLLTVLLKVGKRFRAGETVME